MDEGAIEQAKILIVDDQAANILFLEKLLSASGFTNLVSTTTSGEVLTLCAEREPDLLLLDLQMPEPDGFEVMRQLGYWIKGSPRMPILVLTADGARETKTEALSLGASDFLAKPLDATEVVLRVRNLVVTRLAQLELRNQNVVLDRRVRERTRELEEARFEIVDRLALAAEYRDDDTGEHTRRVGSLSALLAEHLGPPADAVELIRRAAPLHDVGKIAVADTILLKPGTLTPAEFDAMKVHTTIGGKILGGSRSDLLRMSEEIALTHHERWNGSGYPRGLKGEDIPLCGRIVAVADVFDALTHRRPYKEAWPLERALDEIHRLRGTHFDPQVTGILAALPPRVLLEQSHNRLAA